MALSLKDIEKEFREVSDYYIPNVARSLKQKALEKKESMGNVWFKVHS